MTTSIVFTHDGGTPVPSVSSVPVVQGDSFELSVADGGKAVIYFSPELAAIVSPAPGTSLTLGQGSKAQFTFLSSERGAYSLVAAREGDAAPTRFRTEPSSFRTEPSSHVAIGSTFHTLDFGFPISGGGTVSNN